MTVMFCDVRNFTGISEVLTAAELATFMNQYFTYCSEIILSERGTIDKYVGDCVITFWNAPLEQPDHATRACTAAQRICAALPGLRAKFLREFPDKAEHFSSFRLGSASTAGHARSATWGRKTGLTIPFWAIP